MFSKKSNKKLLDKITDELALIQKDMKNQSSIYYEHDDLRKKHFEGGYNQCIIQMVEVLKKLYKENE